MSQPKPKTLPDRIGEAVSTIRGQGKAQVDSWQKAGGKFVISGEHNVRVQILANATVYLQDSRADPDDRLRYLDSLIAIIGVPWGRARTDELWATVYTAWQRAMGLWHWFESQRHLYKPVLMVEVQELVQVPELVLNQKSGTTEMQVKEQWSEPKLIRPETWLARLDEENKSPDSKDARVKYLRTVMSEPVADLSDIPDLDFKQKMAEIAVRNVAEVDMIPTGMIVLDFAFHEMDVTVQSVDVFHTPVLTQTPQQVDVTTRTEGQD